MNPLPEGFKLMLVVTKLKTRDKRRLDFKLVTPSHPSGVLLAASAGAILSALISRYEKPVYRNNLIDSVYGDDESGGPLNCGKIIDVFLCKARHDLRLVGIDFDYRGNYAQHGQATITLSNLRECVPYRASRKRPESGWARCREKAAAARIGRAAEQYANVRRQFDSVPAARISSQCNDVDYKLMKAKQAFRDHTGPLPDLWAKKASTEVWEAQQGKRS